MEASEFSTTTCPPELIAQQPAERRDASRLLVYDRASGAVRHRVFAELPDELSGELAVVNDTRVVPARIRIERPKGEVLLLEHEGGGEWLALARPTRRLRAGRRYGAVELLEHLGEGRWRVRLDGEPDGRGAAAAVHHRAARRSVPLPDGLRGRGRLGRRADCRAPLHAGAARPARRRARHAPRRARHLPPADGGDARGSTSCTASATRSGPRRGSGSRLPSGCSRSGRRRCACSRPWPGTASYKAGRRSSSRPASSSGASTRC